MKAIVWSGCSSKLIFIWLVLILSSPSAASRNVLHVAFHESRPYRVDNRDGSVSGMDLEILRLLGSEMNFSIQVVKCPFSRCLLLMKDSKLDLMTGLLKTTERENYLNYIVPPYYQLNASYSFYARADNPIQITDYNDLEGHTIVQFRGAKYFERYDNDQSLEKIPLVTETKQIEFLLKGRADLMISIDATISNTLMSLNVENKIKRMTFRMKNHVAAYMALSKESPFNQRKDEFQRTLEKIQKDGRLARILARYGIQQKE